MPPDLSGARAKLQRAKEHVQNLYREWDAFKGGNPYRISQKFDPETNRTLYTCGPIPRLPASLSVILGDAIHNFRSALDYVAVALFRAANPGKAAPRIYFPISENETRYVTESPGKTKGIPNAQKGRIDAFRPYGGANNLLWPLHQLDIIDKHHLLVPVATINTGIFVVGRIPCLDLPMTKMLIDGDVLLEAIGHPEDNKDIQFAFDIAFSEPETVKGKSVFAILVLISGQVEAIINAF